MGQVGLGEMVSFCLIAGIKTHTEGIPTAHLTLTCFPWGMTFTTGATKPTKPSSPPSHALGTASLCLSRVGSCCRQLDLRLHPFWRLVTQVSVTKHGLSAVGGNCTIVFYAHTRCVCLPSVCLRALMSRLCLCSAIFYYD